MTEPDFLASCDPAAFPAMAVTVDVVVLAMTKRAVGVLLARRAEHPACGQLALPGVFVGMDEDLRATLDGSPFSFGLLPPEFTLRELQQVHEAVRGRSLNKPAFRKRLLDSGKLVGTDRRDVGGQSRPAELYRVREEAFA